MQQQPNTRHPSMTALEVHIARLQHSLRGGGKTDSILAVAVADVELRRSDRSIKIEEKGEVHRSFEELEVVEVGNWRREGADKLVPKLAM